MCQQATFKASPTLQLVVSESADSQQLISVVASHIGTVTDAATVDACLNGDRCPAKVAALGHGCNNSALVADPSARVLSGASATKDV